MVGSMTTAAGVTIVNSWFDAAKVAAIRLPDRWFGAGRDLHELTAAAAWHDRLLLEFDGQLLIVLTSPSPPVATPDELVIEHFEQLVFDWQEFVNKRPHGEVHNSGSLRFVAQGHLKTMRSA